MIVDPAVVAEGGDAADRALANAGLPRVTRDAADQAFGPGAERWLSDGAWLSVRDAITADPALLGRRAVIDVPASTDIDSAAKGDPSPAAAAALAKLRGQDAVHTGFNTAFLIEADATDPTVVGLWGALKGSLLTMFLTLLQIGRAQVLPPIHHAHLCCSLMLQHNHRISQD